jgi:hypothetical protein
MSISNSQSHLRLPKHPSPMSKAFDHFEFEPEVPPPFWKAFIFAILFALPAAGI